ncbi:ATP-dependent DNA helicase DDX11-like [Lineus longissimus]|uniref:ATP-dependent DNA helicase DDX11-like n=1 Tax=Lineus longissimus TaxID=88925 RepID=UPI002B4CCA72
MKALYQALDGGKIGIFESPTGTGKSLSLICGALTWLRDFEQKQRQEVEALMKEQEEKNKARKEEPDWIAAFTTKQKLDDETKTIKERHEKMLKKEARLKDLRKARPTIKYKKKKSDLDEKFDELFKNAPDEIRHAEDEFDALNSGEDTDDHLVVAEYHSDEEKADVSDDEEDAGEEDEEQCTKIYFCSRTHSQLAQFVREVQKSPFGSDTRVVTLGSRQNLCVNSAVKKLKALSLINDRCLEMQKNKAEKKIEDGGKRKRKKLGGKCPYYKQENLYDFRDKVLVEVSDIEQLVTAGKQTKACPYYGTRYAIPDAQLVALPYNTLLHKSTREACGIKLKDNIVIVDEAHNLVETINNVYSIEVTATQVTCAHSQLSQYMERYRTRLKAKNLMYIKQILFILSNLIKALGGRPGLSAEKQKIEKPEAKLQTINSFLFDTSLDNLNLFKIMSYCGKSKISKKLHGFVEKYHPSVNIQTKPEQKEEKPKTGLTNFLKEISQAKDTKASGPSDENLPFKAPNEEREGITLSSPLMHIEGFLEALTNADKDGRIVINKQGLMSRSSLKFLLLNPVVHFQSIVEEARAVIVAGGTMQPVSEFKEQLFFAAGAKPERILEYSCGHVIPADHLLPIALAKGTTGVALDFTYQSRDTTKTLDELGRIMFNLCNLIPGGIVVFFPSYDYERRVYAHWEQNGMLGRLKTRKQVFREPKNAGQVEAILKEYSNVIEKCKSGGSSGQLTGGLLLSVVGGKMSEGINFSDDLGRCVVMVGLPYPNIKSPELKEKMDYLNANMPRSPDGRLPGQVLYENLCMKAVNQSIGRAIRHRDDYACILLLDQRYHRGNVVNKLPEWISKHLKKMETFGPAVAAVTKFFTDKK